MHTVLMNAHYRKLSNVYINNSSIILQIGIRSGVTSVCKTTFPQKWSYFLGNTSVDERYKQHTYVFPRLSVHIDTWLKFKVNLWYTGHCLWHDVTACDITCVQKYCRSEKFRCYYNFAVETNYKNLTHNYMWQWSMNKCARTSTPPEVNIKSTTTPDSYSAIASNTWLSQYLVVD